MRHNKEKKLKAKTDMLRRNGPIKSPYRVSPEGQIFGLHIMKFVLQFLANANSSSRSLYDVVYPSVVCNARAPYTQAVVIFGNFSTALVPWPSADIHRNFTEIVSGEPLRRGS